MLHVQILQFDIAQLFYRPIDIGLCIKIDPISISNVLLMYPFDPYKIVTRISASDFQTPFLFGRARTESSHITRSQVLMTSMPKKVPTNSIHVKNTLRKDNQLSGNIIDQLDFTA